MNYDLSWVRRLIISPPFGSRIFNSDNYTRVMGTYTAEPRPGWLRQVIKTVRPVPGGWVNKIGLRNPGLFNVTLTKDRIFSITGFNDHNWLVMLEYIRSQIKILGYFPLIELNLSCPNVHEYNISPDILKLLCSELPIICKLPPVLEVYDLASLCMESGALLLHCCNTLPVPRGGESGRRLFEYNLPIVTTLAAKYPGKIIAGGGIIGLEQIMEYKRAGASYFSISSACFTPCKLPSIIRIVNKLERWKRVN